MTNAHRDDDPLTSLEPGNAIDLHLQRGLTFANDALARMVTLSAGLTGGAVFLLTDWTLGLPFRLALILLLMALVCAAQGMVSGAASDIAALDTALVRQQTQQLLRSKIWWLRRALSALLCGLGLAVAGVLLR